MSWIDDALAAYMQRLPRQWKFRVDTVSTSRRSKNIDPADAVEAEGRRVLDMIKAAEYVVILDERGAAFSSMGLVGKLSAWQATGRDLCFVIGGPDGVSKACMKRADFRWSLSTLTLPHGLARVLLVEQLYRAWTVSTGHPYHRA
jgi:23S rRNA (pseudouridine1915-N3)-methyltransferase